MSMVRYYLAQEDEYGVLCIDRLEGTYAEDETLVAALAETYLDVIYFGYWPGDSEMRPVSGNGASASTPEHECEVTRADLDDLRSQLEDRIEALQRDLDAVRESVME